MAKPILEIKLLRDDPLEVVHRFRNLAEDLYRDIEMQALGEVPDIDTLVETIRVIVTDKSRTATVRHIIKKQINQHHFNEDIKVVWHR